MKSLSHGEARKMDILTEALILAGSTLPALGFLGSYLVTLRLCRRLVHSIR
jgi:hypothetical protein